MIIRFSEKLKLCASVFKIGLLMHGKPSNLATLVRWAKMA